MLATDLEWELAEIERAAVEVAAEAGEIVLGYYRQALAVDYKDRERRDPVTEADRAVERRLAEFVGERFPGHALLGEEGSPGSATAEYLWVVDPLDGTTNFVNRLPLFAVSIGVLHRRRPAVGAIFLPGPAELGGGVYHARRNAGAYLGGVRLAAAPGPAPEPSRLVALPGFSDRQFRLGGQLARAAGDPRTLGTAAGELALVASGVFQYALFRAPKIWDVAAGVLLIQEAGGAVYQWRGFLQGWRPFDTFEAGPARPDDPTGLRGWRGSLLVGGAGLARVAAQSVRPTISLGHLLRGLRGRLARRA